MYINICLSSSLFLFVRSDDYQYIVQNCWDGFFYRKRNGLSWIMVERGKPYSLTPPAPGPGAWPSLHSGASRLHLDIKWSPGSGLPQ